MLGYYNTKFHGLIIPFNTIFYIQNLVHNKQSFLFFQN